MRKKFYYGALALGLLFAGCSSDELIESAAPTVSDADQTFYVGMTIRGDVASGTRAGGVDGNPEDGLFDEDGNEIDFEAGTGTENKVNNCYFVFYDASGNVVGDIVPVELNSDDVQQTTTGLDNTVETMYKSVVPVSIRKGENMPTGVICYINPISPSSLQNPLNVIQTRTREEIGTKDGNDILFAMSNSVYYPANEQQPQIVAKIPEEALKKTASEAAAAEDADVVDIYVERYATKLKFTAAAPTTYKTSTRVYPAALDEEDNATGAYSTGYATKLIELDFVPQYWALNAESKTTYVIKSFREESEDGQIMANNYTFDALNARINVNDPANYGGSSLTALPTATAWAWNNANYHRSYWGVSPAYFTSEYPEVSSDVDTELNQTYLSYNDLKKEDKGFAANNTTAQYFKETTVGTKALLSNNPAAAMPSVIYVGQYKMTIGENTYEGANMPGFYTYLSGQVKDGETVVGDRPYIYFENKDNSVESKVDGTSSMLLRFLAQSTILFKKNAANKYDRYLITDAADITKLAGALEVAEITDAVKSKVGDTNKPLKLQANVRSLQFKSAAVAAGIYVATPTGYKEVVADGALIEEGADQIHFSEANATLMQQVGYAYYYNEGKGYFNIPVKHYGWYRGGNAQKNEKKIDWSLVRVGDFGMVRNHSYSVNVTSITGLASGISGDDVAIVPPATTDEYYMAYTVRILKWAVVPTQNVEL